MIPKLTNLYSYRHQMTGVLGRCVISPMVVPCRGSPLFSCVYFGYDGSLLGGSARGRHRGRGSARGRQVQSSAGPCRPGDSISLQHKRLRQLLARARLSRGKSRQGGGPGANGGRGVLPAPRPGSPQHASFLGEPRVFPWARLLELGSLSLRPWGQDAGR